MTDPAELLAGIDAPRPLAPELRDRLEQQLLAGDGARALDPDLTARLTTRLADPVSDLLAGLDAPRPLTPALRADLAAHLRPHRRHRSWAAAVTTAVAASVAAVLLLNAPTNPRSSTQAVGHPSPTPTVQTVPGTVGGLGGGTGGTTGTSGGAIGTGTTTGSTPTPSPVPPPVVALPGLGGPIVAPAPAPAPAPAAGPSTVSPDAGPVAGGTTVRLDGPHLRSARQVEFGAAAGTHLQLQDDGSLTVVTPAAPAPGTVTVTVVLENGSRVTHGASFTYLARPQVDSLSPASGPAAGGTWVTLDGTGLARTTSVRFGSATATKVEAVSDTRVRALSPPQFAGPADVTVVTPGGTSAAVRFLYLP